LGEGLSLTEVIGCLTRRLGVDTRVLPMTDSEVGTRLSTPDGTHPFQEWFVKLRAAGPVEQVVYDGIDGAAATPEALGAIADADLVVIGPSNPVASVEPILTLPGVRELLAARRSSVVAVSPIVAGVPITDTGDAHRARARQEQMRARGLIHTATAVSDLYDELAETFVLDRADAGERAAIENGGQKVELADTIIVDDLTGRRLAATLLACLG
jgi:LPPG:FO 2-phospho-L-lactate transferase